MTAPRSSLVHRFETVRQMSGLPESAFTGNVSADGSWVVDFAATIQKLKNAADSGKPLTLLGTAFFVRSSAGSSGGKYLHFQLPKGSRVMETGGYKNRSRTMPKTELHALIIKQLGVTPDNIVCEYGMSELSSQAYDGVRPSPGAATLHIQTPSDLQEPTDESSWQRPDGRTPVPTSSISLLGAGANHFPRNRTRSRRR